MVPTLNGRIQTRIAALAVIGGLWTLLVTPLLPDGAPLSASYRATFAVLLLAVVLGVVWELIYHGLQQFRWEKDWPTALGLVTVVNEGLLIWILVKTGVGPEVPFGRSCCISSRPGSSCGWWSTDRCVSPSSGGASWEDG